MFGSFGTLFGVLWMCSDLDELGLPVEDDKVLVTIVVVKKDEDDEKIE